VTRLLVDPAIFELFPGLTLVVASARGIDNRENLRTSSYLDDAWECARRLREIYDSPQAHPHVAAWRTAFKAIGVSAREFPPSVEALLKRTFKSPEPLHINPLVDFYNAVSLNHIVPAGGFDLSGVGPILELRLTGSGDEFTPLEGGGTASVGDGEVAYATGSTVLTRHFVWRQSREALITEQTASVVLVAEVLGDLGEDLTEALEADLLHGLQNVFGVRAHIARATKSRRSVWCTTPPAAPTD